LPGGTGRTVSSRLQDRVSVIDFGAVGDGSTDDTVSIQSGIDAAASSGKSLFFPGGTYCITEALILADGSSLVGDAPHPRYGVNSTDMPTKITAGGGCGGFTASGYVLDARQKTNTSIYGLEIVGDGADDQDQVDGTTVGIGYGTDGQVSGGTGYPRHYIGHCSIVRHYKGIGAKQATYFWVEYNNIGSNSYVGAYFDNFSGNDSTFLGNYINTNNRLLTNVVDKVADIYTGAGLVFLEGSGTTYIIGGKIEWNATGIILGEWSQQVMINGVEFDANSKWHIRLRSNSGANHPAWYVQANYNGGSIAHKILNSHFQGGGYLTAITAANLSSHIYFDGQSSDTNAVIDVDIHGNAFWKADSGTDPWPSPDASALYIGAGNYAPVDAIIYGAGGGGTRIRANITSNNFERGATANNITFTSGFKSDSLVSESGNYGTVTWSIGAGTFKAIQNGNQQYNGKVGFGGIPVAAAPVRVYGGPIGLDYAEYLEVAPENGAYLTNKLIGVDFTGAEDRTCIYVPGTATTANPKICIVGLSGYTGIGAGNNTPASTLYVWDKDDLNPTSVAVRQSATQGTIGPLSVANSAGTILTQVRPNGSVAMNGVAFAGLALWDNGTFVWCTDCNVATPCTGGGAGAWAFSSNGTWKCPF